MKNNPMPAGETLDVFTWRGIKIYQADPVFKIGTDALLLGGWIPTVVESAQKILDVGTGTGILSIMMAHSFPQAIIRGIDVEGLAIQLALKNVQTQSWENRVEIDKEDITCFTERAVQEYDLVVCNPPFFTSGIRASEPERAIARHLEHTMDAWTKGFVRRVTSSGHICIIVPFALAHTWIRYFNEQGYYVRHRMDVRSYSTDTEPVRSLLHIRHGVEQMQLTHLTIRMEQSGYTGEYLRLTGIRPA